MVDNMSLKSKSNPRPPVKARYHLNGKRVYLCFEYTCHCEFWKTHDDRNGYVFQLTDGCSYHLSPGKEPKEFPLRHIGGVLPNLQLRTDPPKVISENKKIGKKTEKLSSGALVLPEAHFKKFEKLEGYCHDQLIENSVNSQGS